MIMRIFFAVLITLISIPAMETTGNMFRDCSSNSYSCGAQNYTISYPFRNPDMPNYCGHPNFELQCTQTKTKSLSMEINKIQFQIKFIDYGRKLLRLSYPNLQEIISSPHLTNITVDSSFFSSTSSDRALNVYYGCPFPLPDNLSFVACLFGNNKDNFCFSLEKKFPVRNVEELQACTLYEIFVLEADAEGLLKEAFALLKALDQGFELNWTAGDGWCDECTHSEGVCGSDPDLANSPACFCSDGNATPTTCENSLPAGKKKKLSTVIGIVSSLGGGLLLGTCMILLLRVSRRRKLKASSTLFLKMNPGEAGTCYATHIFSYDELEKATQGFHESRELGHGGFGTVYKGKLRDGRTVAVKRLHERNRRLEQFTNEIEILSCLRHQNLVTLYGCTSHHSLELLLVYEYIPNGTLADHLHGPLASKHELPWPTRMSIIIQTTEALSYLHSAEPPIIYRDIKTNNILLDDNFQVKVADFGISRLFPVNATHVSTGPQGTFGYLDPEYYLRFQLTDKSDVYSFGVVMIELISSKTPVDITRNSDEISLANMAITKIRNCRLEELVDPDLGYKDCLEIREMIDHVAQLAFRCLLSDAETRPSLKEVLAVLKRINGEVDAEGVSRDQVKVESTLLSHVEVFSSDHITGR